MTVNVTRPTTKDRKAFVLFYDLYAPRLWGLIVLADLPVSQARTILVNTFTTAWRHPRQRTIGPQQVLPWLMSLARAEGLPAGTLNAALGVRSDKNHPAG